MHRWADKMTPKALGIVKTVAIVLMFVGLIGQGLSQGIWTHYFHTLPRSPDPATGRVYPPNMHGIITYQTPEERWLLSAAEYLSGGVFFVGLLIGFFQHWESGGFNKGVGYARNGHK